MKVKGQTCLFLSNPPLFWTSFYSFFPPSNSFCIPPDLVCFSNLYSFIVLWTSFYTMIFSRLVSLAATKSQNYLNPLVGFSCLFSKCIGSWRSCICSSRATPRFFCVASILLLLLVLLSLHRMLVTLGCHTIVLQSDAVYNVQNEMGKCENVEVSNFLTQLGFGVPVAMQTYRPLVAAPHTMSKLPFDMTLRMAGLCRDFGRPPRLLGFPV